MAFRQKPLSLEMILRIVMLVVAFLVTMPVLSFAASMVSAKNDWMVIVGFASYITLAVAWFYFVKYLVYSVKERIERDAKLIIVGLVLSSAILSTACGRTVVDPGYVGVKVNYYGEDKGVESYPKVTGVAWYNPVSESVFQYPTFVQNAVWTHNLNEGKAVNEEITFTTSDQMQVAADISLGYHLVADKVPAFYVKFRSDDLDTFTHGFLRNLAREKFDNVAGKYKIEQIMGDNAPFLNETRESLQKDLEPIGVKIDQFGFIGAPRPPQQVIDSINAKVKATQDAIRVENEVRQTQAEAQKKIAQAEGDAKAAIAKAQGEARANELVNSSLTNNLLEWRKLDIQANATGRWNGSLPTYMGGTMPLIQLPSPK